MRRTRPCSASPNILWKQEEDTCYLQNNGMNITQIITPAPFCCFLLIYFDHGISFLGGQASPVKYSVTRDICKALETR